MNAIVYGNLSIEVASPHGVRLTRLTERQDPLELLQLRDPDVPAKPAIIGREEQSLVAFRAIREGRPVVFYSDCGYGKTTLLQHVAARAAEWYGASRCVFLPAARCGAEDLLAQLVAQLYCSDRPVKLTTGECAQLLGQSGRIVIVDDAPADPAQVGWLLEALPGCTLVIGCARRVTVPGGSSHNLPGLSAKAVLELLADVLGRPVTSEELPAVRCLADAVDGQPLHLKQAAALVREGRYSLASLASQAAADPAALDRLCIDTLSGAQRRALAVLAFAAGVLLPAELVEVIGQVSELGECLELLGRRGLAEQRDDRFGLPVCKAENYCAILLGDLQLGAAAGSLGRWLADRDAADSEGWPGAEAALAIIEFAAERKDWTTIIQLTRATEQILFIAARWEALHHVLTQGLAAAKAVHDRAAEAFFSHQLGSLEFCLDHLGEAAQLLRHALTLREQAGDNEGAGLTRENLRLLGPAGSPPRPPRPPRIRRGSGRPRPTVLALSALLTVVTLVVGAVAGAVNRGDGTGPGPTPTPTPTHTPIPTPSATPTPSTPRPSESKSGGAGTHGKERVRVPSVIGQSQDHAIASLANAGLTAVPTTTTRCDTAANGNVVSQSPVGGTSVPRGRQVTISTCSAPALVVVPTVIGQTQDQATASLATAGLTAVPGPVGCRGLHIPNGDVGIQSPAGGTSAPRSSNVTIGICSTFVQIPAVIGKTRDQAIDALTSAGLTANVSTTTDCDTTANGTVTAQAPDGGTSAPQGTGVAITVCDNPPPPSS